MIHDLSKVLPETRKNKREKLKSEKKKPLTGGEKQKRQREKYKKYNLAHPVDPTKVTQKCTRCGDVKFLTEFAKATASPPPGYRSDCKICVNKNAEKKAEINREKNKDIDPEKTTQECHDCGKILPLTMFDKYESNGIGFAYQCKICKHEARCQNDNPQTEGTKKCAGCGQLKDVSEFHKATDSKKDGLNSSCKECRKKIQTESQSILEGFVREKIKDARERCKKDSFKLKNVSLNINKEQIVALFKLQNGLCALTGEQLTHTTKTERKNDDQHIINLTNLSIDRIDPNFGYMLGNVRLVCAIVNKIKWTMSDGSLLTLCSNVDFTANLRIIDNKFKKKINKQNLLDDYKIDVNQHILSISKMRISNAKYNASKKKGFDCVVNITVDDIINKYIEQQGRCFLSGQLFSTNSKENKSCNNLSLDRIDSKKGYVKDNIQLVTEIVNNSKSDLSNDDYIEWCRKIKYGFQKGCFLSYMK